MEADVLTYRGKKAAYANLVNKIKQLEGITHMIAHNLRGAGSNIKLLSDVLMLKNIVETGTATDIEGDIFTTNEAVQYINESSVSLLSTLNTLMEVADIQLNDQIKRDECDIRHIVDNIFHQLHGFFHQKHAAIEFDLAVTHISYPEAYMENILYNFINNALKYSKPNVPLKIIVSAYMLHGRPVLSVKDNGLGIDLEKYSNRIFKLNQVFHQGYESKGIGLYITKTQIESMGGTIDVKSEVGVGSEFIVTF
jgi:signal transduction histidine kinase